MVKANFIVYKYWNNKKISFKLDVEIKYFLIHVKIYCNDNEAGPNFVEQFCLVTLYILVKFKMKIKSLLVANIILFVIEYYFIIFSVKEAQFNEIVIISSMEFLKIN